MNSFCLLLFLVFIVNCVLAFPFFPLAVRSGYGCLPCWFPFFLCLDIFMDLVMEGGFLDILIIIGQANEI